MGVYRVLALLMVGLLLTTATAGVNAKGMKACKARQYIQADADLSKASNWGDLYNWYTRHNACSDGYLDEGISDRMGTLLDDQWFDLPDLQGITSKDPSFTTFVLKHINTTLDSEMLESMESNASQRCPDGLMKLCQRIQDSSHAAQN